MTIQPLYVSATKQDTGKTTVTIGLMKALRDLGCNVGYAKPVGQRYVKYNGLNVDEDAVLAREAFGLTDHPADMSPVAIERGFTEKYIFNRNPEPLERRILDSVGRLRRAHEVLVIEGTGHAGVGSCFDLSNARVAELLGAAVIIVTDGGIGRAIDEVALSLHLFRKHGVRVLGIVLNKVLPQKFEKVSKAVAEGLRHLDSRLLGALPYQARLPLPRMSQIVAELPARVLCGEQALNNCAEHTVVAAMAPQHVCNHIMENTLVVTPGDRIDNILISIVICPAEPGPPRRVSGLILTGGFIPPPSIVSLLRVSGVPVLLCQGDTYSVASRLRDLVFKIRPEDTDKIAAVQALIREQMDVNALLADLSRPG
jgi:hypothetical protein